MVFCGLYAVLYTYYETICVMAKVHRLHFTRTCCVFDMSSTWLDCRASFWRTVLTTDCRVSTALCRANGIWTYITYKTTWLVFMKPKKRKLGFTATEASEQHALINRCHFLKLFPNDNFSKYVKFPFSAAPL